MRHTRKILLAAAALTVMGTAGCGQKPSLATAPSVKPTASVQTTPHTSVSPNAAAAASKAPAASPEAEKKLVVESYYGDPDMLKLVAKPSTILYAKEGEQYLAALNALKKSSSADAVSLCPDIVFRSAKLNGSKLTVDLSIPDKARLGSDGESMLMDALKKTLFQFSEVQTFELLVDGKKAETLMGHLELQYPFKRTSK